MELQSDEIYSWYALDADVENLRFALKYVRGNDDGIISRISLSFDT